MTDPDKQAAFVSGLRKIAEEAAAKNPTLADMRALAKTLVTETRKRIANGEPCSPLGAHMGNDGGVSMLKPDPNQGNADILRKLASLANEGNVRAAAVSEVVDKQLPGRSIMKFIQVHMEHIGGKAFISAVPADESVLLKGLPGADGPALCVFGGPTQPKIFLARS
jgi:hypothetical protein